MSASISQKISPAFLYGLFFLKFNKINGLHILQRPNSEIFTLSNAQTRKLLNPWRVLFLPKGDFADVAQIEGGGGDSQSLEYPAHGGKRDNALAFFEARNLRPLNAYLFP